MSELEQNTIVKLEETGRQIKKAFSDLISEFPESVQTITDMSNWLEVNRSSCQRICNAINRDKSGIDVLCSLPGISGIFEFIEATKSHNISSTKVKHAQKALALFESTIKKYSRSHSELKKILGAINHPSVSQPLSTEQINLKRQHFELTKGLLGESTNLIFVSFILSEVDVNDEYLLECALVSKQGVYHRAGSRPFTQFYSHVNNTGNLKPHLFSQQTKLKKDKFQVGILEDYSSPEITQGQVNYSQTQRTLIFDKIQNNAQKIDSTILFVNPDEVKNPLKKQSKGSSTSIMIKNPTERLVMMVFLEKKLDMRSSVNIGCFATDTSIPEDDLNVLEIEHEKFPELPEIKIVNLENLVDSGQMTAKNLEMVDSVFGMIALNKNNFICYMIDVPYPIWSSTYRIYFEHG